MQEVPAHSKAAKTNRPVVEEPLTTYGPTWTISLDPGDCRVWMEPAHLGC